MIKEKLIFCPLLVVLIGILAFGLISHGDKKKRDLSLSKDIELATKKMAVKKKTPKDMWGFDKIMAIDTIDGYSTLLERSPFFRIKKEGESTQNLEPIVIKEEPKEPLLKYKGRVIIGDRLMVIIEDRGTGKSSFVEEGDMVAGFLVLRIDDTGVTLRKKSGEEIVLKASKEKQ